MKKKQKSEKSKVASDGSTASYYELPVGCSELQHLISHKDMNAQLGEIFRACYRYGEAEHSAKERDLKKIIFYAEAELERLASIAATGCSFSKCIAGEEATKGEYRKYTVGDHLEQQRIKREEANFIAASRQEEKSTELTKENIFYKERYQECVNLAHRANETLDNFQRLHITTPLTIGSLFNLFENLRDKLQEISGLKKTGDTPSSIDLDDPNLRN